MLSAGSVVLARLGSDAGGRDHWPKLSTLALAGGGLKMGQVVGASDRTASSPSRDPYGPRHLLGTVLNTMFDVGELRLEPKIPRAIQRIINAGDTIAPLHG